MSDADGREREMSQRAERWEEPLLRLTVVWPFAWGSGTGSMPWRLVRLREGEEGERLMSMNVDGGKVH